LKCCIENFGCPALFVHHAEVFQAKPLAGAAKVNVFFLKPSVTF
jgi:hypothetical protein